MIQEIKNSCSKTSPNKGNDNNKDYLCDSEFRSSVQIEQSSTCIDIEVIWKESDVEYDNEQESKQSINKSSSFKSSTLIYSDAATKIHNSISQETKTVEVHQGQFATPNAMRENVYHNEPAPWPVNTILIAGDSMELTKRGSQRKIQMLKLDTSTER